MNEQNEKGLPIEIDIEELRNKARDEALRKKHKWIQKGTFIICESCEFRHSFYIPPDKIMVGIDKKGMPIIKSKQFFKKKS